MLAVKHPSREPPALGHAFHTGLFEQVPEPSGRASAILDVVTRRHVHIAVPELLRCGQQSVSRRT